MKLVTAVIKPFKLDEVRDALERIGVHGMTRPRSRATAGRRATPKSIGAPNTSSPSCRRSGSRSWLPTLASTTPSRRSSSTARTGVIGDGKIFVIPLERALSIRTGETATTPFDRSGANAAADGGAQRRPGIRPMSEADSARACAARGPTADSDPGFAVYVHWPFCLSKCPYCDFNSHVRGAAIDEARYRRRLPRRDRPSRRARARPHGRLDLLRRRHALADGARRRSPAILDAIAAHWAIAPDAEITLEANPTSVEAGRFRGYRAAGVNRLSVGVQALARRRSRGARAPA